jgi:hypothetical protein
MEKDGEDGLEKVEKDIKKAEGEVKAAITVLQDEENTLEAAEHEIERIEHKPVHFTVDGEPCESKEHVLTPDQIIREFGGGKDPKTNYLVQITGGQKTSYKDKGHEPIKLCDGMSFQIISTGPTPVSDGRTRTSVEVFADGLRELGHEPKPVAGRADHLVVDYEVPCGRFAGRRVRHGFVVPPDFPLSAPSGPHVSPNIHPIQPGGSHPTGGVHADQARAFKSNDADQWQYWSRPFQNWGQTKRTVTVYMAFIWRLWETQ